MSSTPTPDEVAEQLRLKLRGRAWDLHVTFHDGRVVLSGKASSYYAKQMAQHFVLKALATAALVNQIEVSYTAP